MLRALHPDQEVANYQSVWKGDSWRLYDWTPPRPLPDYSALMTAPRKSTRGRPGEALMLGWLTQEPRMARTAAADLGISYNAAVSLLWRLTQRGLCIRTRERRYRTRITFYARAK